MDRYVVVQFVDYHQFVNEINRLIGLGYRPVGGVTVNTHLYEPDRYGIFKATRVVYHQAMMK